MTLLLFSFTQFPDRRIRTDERAHAGIGRQRDVAVSGEASELGAVQLYRGPLRYSLSVAEAPKALVLSKVVVVQVFLYLRGHREHVLLQPFEAPSLVVREVLGKTGPPPELHHAAGAGGAIRICARLVCDLVLQPSMRG